MFVIRFFTQRTILNRFLGSVGRFGLGVVGAGRGNRGEMSDRTRDFQVEKSIFSTFNKIVPNRSGKPPGVFWAHFLRISNSGGPRRPANHRYYALNVDFEPRFSPNPAVSEIFWKVFDFFSETPRFREKRGSKSTFRA